MSVPAGSPAAAPSRPPRRVRLRGWAFASALLLVALTLGVVNGPAHLPGWSVAMALLDAVPGIRIDHGLDDRQLAMLWQLRVPRVTLSAIVGAVLAGAGAAYQGVFRNPLADPYLLGVAAGAGLGATIVIAAGVAPIGVWSQPLFAFIGAVAAVTATWTMGRAAGGRGTATLILAGIAVGSFLSATQTYLMQRDADTIRDVYAFLLGQLSTAGWGSIQLIAPWVAIAVIGMLALRNRLDVLAVGDLEADSLGISSAQVRLSMVAFATLGTAVVVSVSGLIGFVGIVVPHAVRLVTGTSYRTLLPLSLIAGAAFLVLADLLARTALAPAELPIGVVTAFIGGPFFVVVLRRARQAAM